MQSNLSWTAKPTQRIHVAFVFPCAVGTGKNGLRGVARPYGKGQSVGGGKVGFAKAKNVSKSF